MKNIDEYISDLLYNHDCVILPEFGGFVASYAPSHIPPSRRILYPPSKNVLFNVRLQTNDGLLANHIAEKEKIPYQESIQRIQQFTLHCMNSLNEGKSVVFEQMGTFRANQEGKIEFTPFKELNYLEDAYGLTPLVPPPMTGQKRKPVKSPVISRKSPRKPTQVKKAIPRLVFVTILFAILAFWGYYHSPLFKDIYTNYSGIIPLIKASHQQSPVATGAHPDAITPAVPAIETSTPVDIPKPVDEEVTVPSLVASPNPDVPVKKYFIIAGAFKEKMNATSLILQLEKKGYEACMAGRTKGGLYRVCYGAYPGRRQALQALETIRQEEDQNAWLMIE
ncbi:MAG: SPOR domain-containing protein [Bacteroidales bacterium]|nr:SPOR domain-containing protein [Lentimicrobiaceae bacterium]MDD5694512.1 SPOR domain-containing protein [Bacteroidales bacterium]